MLSPDAAIRPRPMVPDARAASGGAPAPGDRAAPGDDVELSAARLIDWCRRHAPLVVAFSGGVDSSVVAAAAHRADPSGAIAVTADSPAVARWQLDLAVRIARDIGIRHRVITTGEVARDDYRRNDRRRCYFCKSTLYDALRAFETAAGGVPVSGTNADDLGDYRPGLRAATEASVRAPLAELGFGKAGVRDMARWFGLANAELPASPCLASRIAYGVEVTPERLARVEAAEGWLRSAGFSDVRVRVHPDELARVEVPLAEWGRLGEASLWRPLDEKLRSLGFRFVTVDTGGLRSGSLNPPLVELSPPSAGQSGGETGPS